MPQGLGCCAFGDRNDKQHDLSLCLEVLVVFRIVFANISASIITCYFFSFFDSCTVHLEAIKAFILSN